MSQPESLLILPGSEEFEDTLAMSLPIGWQHTANANSGDYGFVVDSQTGLLRIENSAGVREYVNGGEYDERLELIEDDDLIYL